MAEKQNESEPRIKRAWAATVAWIAGITTVVGFIGTLSGAFKDIAGHFGQHKASDAQIAIAQTQLQEGEYQQSFETYTTVLKTDPGYKPAVQGQLNAAEKWTENFELDNSEDKGAVAAATASLGQLATVFEEALGQTKGPQKADVQAHLGWVHWLDHHILGQDTAPAAEKDLRAALALDPKNIYANAMLGNYLLQTYRSLDEAVQNFNAALAAGGDRAYVRRLQLAGLIRLEEPGARAALIRALNEMRKNGEPLDADTRLNARGFCCIPNETSHDEFVESLSAVPRDDAFQTYVWLNATNIYVPPSVLKLDEVYVQALLNEIAGNNAEALQGLRELNKKIAGVNTNLDECVPEEIQRLTQSAVGTAKK